jgi:putative spermidine/putrescine transport system permease protein
LNNKWSWFLPGVFLTFTAVPLILGFGYAALYSVGLAGVISHGWTLQHWSHTITSSEVASSFGFSFYVATVTVILAVMLSLFLTFHLRNEITLRWFSTILYFPLAIPSIVAAFFSFQLLSKAGFASRVFFQAGWIQRLDQFPDLINDRLGIGIILTHAMMAIPFFTILFSNLYDSEKLDELHRLARTLGANSVQANVRIGIPILLRRAYPVLVLYFIFVFGSYEIPLLLGRQSPQMISVLMIRKLQRFNLLDIPTAYTLAILYLILAAGMVLLLFRKKRLAYDI